MAARSISRPLTRLHRWGMLLTREAVIHSAYAAVPSGGASSVYGRRKRRAHESVSGLWAFSAPAD